MSSVKVLWRKETPKNTELSAMDYEKYLLKDRGTELVIESSNCTAGSVIEKFMETQAIHGKNIARSGQSVNVAFEVIHSFNESESKALSSKNINSMGVELAKRYFPNHEFMVVTHTDTKHTHNHILVNPVNESTGKRDIIDKKEHLYNLRAIANDISRENGLSVIKTTEKERQRNIPQKVKEIERRGGKSYRLDLFQKADFARSYATSFDEYVGILNELSVKTAITDKNITYFYKGHEKGIRGKKLGSFYDKSGLIEKFKSNDELFINQPQLRRKILDGISDFKTGKRDSMGVSSSLLLDRRNVQDIKDKNYESFTKSHRASDRTPLPSDHALRDSIIPISELRKASNCDILEYFKKHDIKYETDKEGRSYLKGKKHIEINGNRWTNTKNKTTGSLIEFVSIHDDVSFLGAISKITGNRNLLLLEEHFGKVKKPYKSFYVPDYKKGDIKKAKTAVHSFLKKNGMDSKNTDDLFKLKQVDVDKNGGIWFFLDDKKSTAVEFTKDSDQNYKSKYYGDKDAPITHSYKNESSLKVYDSFLSFLKTNGKNAINNKSKSSLVLSGLEERAFHIFLATRPNINKIEFVLSENKKDQENQLNFIDQQRKKLKFLNISVTSISLNKARSRSRGIDFDF